MKKMMVALFLLFIGGLAAVSAPAQRRAGSARTSLIPVDRPAERPEDPPRPRPEVAPAGVIEHSGPWVRGKFESIQVNVDADGANIPGDAANEPSIAVDPTNPATIVIGWRQFNSVQSNFREAGWGYSHNAGQDWTFPGTLEPGIFRSDPVLEADADGNIFYYSLVTPGGQFLCDLWKSTDGGVTWEKPVYAYGGDKSWFTIDKTNRASRGNIYAAWSAAAGCCGANIFNRSLTDGATFEFPRVLPQSPRWGTVAVGPGGEVYISGMGGGGAVVVVKSIDAQYPGFAPSFTQGSLVDLDGRPNSFNGTSPNPGGLLGQVNIVVSHAPGPSHGHVYVLASVARFDGDPLDVMFARSTDGGLTWSEPVRVNDDPEDNNAWQWFAVMSIAPNGRIDVAWNDTRNDPTATFSELYYAQSFDGGETWSTNVPASIPFDPSDGYPQQNKIGDYYDMASDDTGASLAYAATFNGEHDVYFLRIGDFDCNHNGVPDDQDIAEGASDDCDANGLPDECGRDCNKNKLPDTCEALDGLVDDCNSNLVPDECEADFDADGVIDGCDPDRDGDGVPNAFDACPRTPPGTPVRFNGGPVGDKTGDCRIGLEDFSSFAPCIANGGPNKSTERGCQIFFDYDLDEDIDLMDAARLQSLFAGDSASPPG